MKIAVIGLGQFGTQLAIALAEDHHEVLAIDKDEKPVELIKDKVAHGAIADAEDPKALEQLGLTEMDKVCVTIGEDFSAALLVTGQLQELGVKDLYCRCVNSVQKRLLHLMKVTNLVEVEDLAARQLAKRMGIRGATRHFGLSDQFGIVELQVPDFLIGKTLHEANLRERCAVNLITVKREVEEKPKVLGVLEPDFTFEELDELYLFGTEDNLKKFSNKKEL